MKVLAVFIAIVGVALAAPAGGPESTAQVLRSDLNNIGVDGFNWSYETDNGISAEETGHLINPNTDNEGIAVQGSYKYTGPDNVVYTMTYIADENGFQPQGAHIPH